MTVLTPVLSFAGKESKVSICFIPCAFKGQLEISLILSVLLIYKLNVNFKAQTSFNLYVVPSRGPGEEGSTKIIIKGDEHGWNIMEIDLPKVTRTAMTKHSSMYTQHLFTVFKQVK